MKKLFGLVVAAMFMFSCGPNSEQKEQQRIQDSIQAETDRLSSIEDADAFILQNEVDTSDLNEVVVDN
jgi:hypothetical protein